MPDTDKCPLCGKSTTEGETFCHDCREIAEKSYSAELLSHSEDTKQPVYTSTGDAIAVEEQTAELPAPKKKRKELMFVILILVLILLAGGVGSYIFIQDKNVTETEVAYWNLCAEENTPLAYSNYLVQYPNGVYNMEAQSRIAALRNNERKEWESARRSNNADILLFFLETHPQSPYEREARNVADSLAWFNAATVNTSDSYSTYLEKIKAGVLPGYYQNMAQEKYDYLSALKLVDGQDLSEMKQIVTSFFKSLSSTDDKDIQKLTTPVLARFYALTRSSKSSLIASVKADFTKNKIKKVTHTPVMDSIIVIKDNMGIFFLTVPVKEETIYLDRNKKNSNVEYIANIELNTRKLLQSVYK